MLLGVTGWSAVLMAVAAAWAGHPAAAADLTEKGTDERAVGASGFWEVTVDLDLGTFDRVLDFDRPILIKGDVPEDLADDGGIRILYAEDRGALTPADAATSRADEATCRVRRQRDGTSVDLRPRDREGNEVPIEARISAPATDGGKRTFQAVVEALRPNRYFLFCFLFDTEVSETEARDFRRRAREVLDQQLAQVQSANIDEAEARQLSRGLQHALLQVTGADRILDPRSLFVESQAEDELTGLTDLNNLVREVLGPQINNDRILNGDPDFDPPVPSYRERQLALRNHLVAIADDATLAKLLRLLEAGATDQSQSTWLEEYSAAIALARLSEPQAVRVAFGQAPSGGQTATVLDTREPEVAAEIQQSYGDTAAALEKLQTLVEDKVFAEQPPIDVRGGLTSDEEQALRDLVDTGAVGQAAATAGELENDVGRIQRNLTARGKALDTLAERAEILARQMRFADGSSTLAFDTLEGVYISADAGVAFAPEIDEVRPYVGTNIYLRPINKDVPLNQAGSFLHRFAFTIGLTVSGIDDGDPSGEPATPQIREGLFGDQSLLIGVGIRINRMMRFGAGALVFREQDPNPLIDEFSVTATPYVTLSFDLNVAKAFQGGLGGLFE